MSAPAVAVTGGAGFIGAHLCRALAGRGFHVRCIDRLSGVYARGSGDDAWGSLGALPNIALVRADLGRDAIEPLLDGTHGVIHLAGLPGVRAGHAPARLWEDNALVTARLVRAAARRGRRLVLASTSSVYGNSERLPTAEDAPTAPLNPYAVSKLGAEQACLDAASRHGADVVIARLFTVFGPGQRPDMAFARWIDAILTGRPVEWCAKATAAREFTYVDDAVAGLISAFEHGRSGQVYNVAGCGRTPLRRALAMLEALLGRPALVRRTQPFAGEAEITAACGKKAARELGYQPAMSLGQGLERQAIAALSRSRRGSSAARAGRLPSLRVGLPVAGAGRFEAVGPGAG